MIDLFQLVKDESEGRSGIDAYLKFKGKMIPFELKTTSNSSITTVRDFGPDHIQKWKGKHWLFGFYRNGDVKYKYGSPSMMDPWIIEKANYIAPDFMLADIVSSKITLDDLFVICKKKDIYSYIDAKKIQKMQYSRSKYRDMEDLPNGYSPEKMLCILKDRAEYLVKRGSTLNNPHIPGSYFAGWEEINNNHAQRLIELVDASIGQEELKMLPDAII